MLIDNTSWTQLTTDTGALIQKSGTGTVVVVYAAAAPTFPDAAEDSFAITDNEAQVMPASSGFNIYAKSIQASGNVSIQVI